MSMKIKKMTDRSGVVFTPLVSVDSVFYGNSSIKNTLLGAVQGPSSSVSNNVPLFSGTTGKLVIDSGITVTKSNVGSDTVYTLTLA